MFDKISNLWEILEWYTRRDSNPQPPGSKPGALSIELRVHGGILWHDRPRWGPNPLVHSLALFQSPVQISY